MLKWHRLCLSQDQHIHGLMYYLENSSDGLLDGHYLLSTVAFVASGFSANLRGLIAPIGITLPNALSNTFGNKGGVIDIIAAVVIILTALLLSRGVTEAARMENILVILKVLAIILFVIVGLTAINFSNSYHLCLRVTKSGDFGGWQGIYAGVSMIFLAYIGFDSIAANSAEAINPQNNA